jgi:hypothetical protein
MVSDMHICSTIKGFMPACLWWDRQPVAVKRLLTLLGVGAVAGLGMLLLSSGEPEFYRWTWHIPG